MTNRFNSSAQFAAAMCIAAALICISGCQQSTASKSAKKPLPKMDFHKPASYTAAVRRIGEIHQQLVSADKLPEPISYKVKEVNHAHGAGQSHVHYHLVGDDHDHDHPHDHAHDDGHSHDHDHSHDDPSAPEHTIVVDTFTELSDIVRWLPKIAADGDMSVDEWNEVNGISEELTLQLETVISGKSDSEQLDGYKAQAETVEASLTKLESLVKSSGVPAKGLLD